MKPVETLRIEHRRIEQMLDVLETAAIQIESSEVVPSYVTDLLDFFEHYADIGHHAKEEAFLFPAMVNRGIGPDGLVNAMTHQHGLGRVHVRDMRRSLERLRQRDHTARAAFATSAQAYVELLRVHIQIEDDDLYPVAEQLFTPEEERELERHFDVVDRSPDVLDERARWELLLVRAQQPAGH